MRRLLIALALLVGLGQPAAALSPAVRTAVLAPAVDADYRVAIAAMTVKPTGANLRLGNQAVRGLKAAGLWPTIDLLNGFCPALHDGQAFRINLRRPNVVGVEVSSPTFTANAGYTFNGTSSYVDTNYKPSTDASNLTATSGTAGAYERTNVSGTTSAMGAQFTGTDRITVQPRLGANTVRGAMMSTVQASAATTTDSRGFTAVTRISGVFALYRNGGAFDTIAPVTTTGVLPARNIWIGAENNNGVFGSGRASQIAGVVVASGWSAAQVGAFYAVMQPCLVALGAGA